MPTLIVSMSVQAASVPVEDIGQSAEGITTLRDASSTSGADSYVSTTSSAGKLPASNAAASSDPYYRMQLLMEEIRQLRGLLEEQGNELALLKKRQREDYIDLDGRLMALNSGGSSTGLSTAAAAGASPVGDPASGGSLPRRDVISGAAPVTGSGAAAAGSSASGIAEKAAYDHAYGLLKARQIDEAKVALKQFLQDYPQGVYAANAHYWLGEVYLLASQLPEAEAEFLAVVEQYPGHRKVNDATFKLGKAYYLQDKREQSKALLERVAKGADSAARLAQDFLARHF